jgi:hypothetical protein
LFRIKRVLIIQKAISPMNLEKWAVSSHPEQMGVMHLECKASRADWGALELKMDLLVTAPVLLDIRLIEEEKICRVTLDKIGF